MRGVDLLVIQPTPFCNINCDYCYLPDRNNPKKISAEIIEQAIAKLLAAGLIGTELSVVWHAGEPLVLPPSFYQPLFELLDKNLVQLGYHLHHSIQTNGTLITQEWCDFIKARGIKLGVSIDGPKELHDKHRVTRSGKGSFDKVMEGLSLLRDNNISCHAIAVVTEQSLTDPDGFFDFFHEQGFYELGLNIEEIEGVHRQSSLFSIDNIERIRLFYRGLLRRYINSDRRMHIREFDRALAAITREPSVADIRELPAENHQNRKFGILSIDYLGNFSTFSPELIGQSAPVFNNFIFGNVLQQGFLEEDAAMLKAEQEIRQGIEKCRSTCDYFAVCGGGAPANKFFENGSFNSSITNYCRYNIQLPTELVLEYMEEEFALT